MVSETPALDPAYRPTRYLLMTLDFVEDLTRQARKASA